MVNMRRFRAFEKPVRGALPINAPLPPLQPYIDARVATARNAGATQNGIGSSQDLKKRITNIRQGSFAPRCTTCEFLHRVGCGTRNGVVLASPKVYLKATLKPINRPHPQIRIRRGINAKRLRSPDLTPEAADSL